MLRRLLRLRLPIPKNLTLPPRFIFAANGISIMVAAIIIHFVDKGETAPLAWAFIALIAASSFLRSVPAPEGLTTLVAMGAYGGLQLARTVQGGNYFTEAFAGTFAFVLVAWLSRASAQHLSRIEDEAERSAMLVEELTARDDVTGAIKRRHAHQLLVEEVQRSRRYDHTLSLLVLDFDEWESVLKDQGPKEATKLLAILGGIVIKMLRNVDRVARHNESQFAVILPETPVDGARRVAEKICQQATDQLGVSVRVGIAEFPTDAVSSDELVAEAEAALEFSKTASLRITDRSLIS